jgi:hypothetical protein
MMDLPNRRRIDQINDMWRDDAPYSTDPLKLPEEGSRTLSDIQKYHDIKTKEQRRLRELSIQTEAFRFKLMRFFRDGPAGSTDEMWIIFKERAWELPPGGKPSIKTDVKFWVDSNPGMTELILALSEQNDIIELIDGIIKALHARAVLLSSTMKQVRFNLGSDY